MANMKISRADKIDNFRAVAESLPLTCLPNYLETPASRGCGFPCLIRKYRECIYSQSLTGFPRFFCTLASISSKVTQFVKVMKESVSSLVQARHDHNLLNIHGNQASVRGLITLIVHKGQYSLQWPPNRYTSTHDYRQVYPCKSPEAYYLTLLTLGLLIFPRLPSSLTHSFYSHSKFNQN